VRIGTKLITSGISVILRTFVSKRSACHRERLDPELCVQYQGQPIVGDVSNPRYEAFLRHQIRHLMIDVGADGFKEDWIGGLAAVPGLITHGPLFGIEFLRRFQSILHDEAHACKTDALVETQTPHPHQHANGNRNPHQHTHCDKCGGNHHTDAPTHPHEYTDEYSHSYQYTHAHPHRR
jgi:hypothetical protein